MAGYKHRKSEYKTNIDLGIDAAGAVMGIEHDNTEPIKQALGHQLYNQLILKGLINHNISRDSERKPNGGQVYTTYHSFDMPCRDVTLVSGNNQIIGYSGIIDLPDSNEAEKFFKTNKETLEKMVLGNAQGITLIVTDLSKFQKPQQ